MFSKKYKQYQRFYIQWKTLCFGPTPAPIVSTNIVSIIAALLRSQNIRIAVFLDDWFLVNQSHRYFLQDREKCVNLLISLGFIMNTEKSNVETIRKLQFAIQNLIKGQNTPRCYPHLLGIMASCIEMISNAHLYIRQIQRYLICFCRPVSQNLEGIIPFTPHLKSTKAQKDHSRF